MWSLESWREKPAKQQPKYDDDSKLKSSIDKVKSLPPLVAISEIDGLKQRLSECALGKRFLLQGGDCAERFDECGASFIENKIKILLQMSLIVTHEAKMPTLRIGRMAGQFGKPRSKDTEMINGVEYASYRGDNVNGYEIKDRKPDPNRLVEGYFHSAATINYARAVIADGLADLRHADAWDMGFVKNEKRRDEYHSIATEIVKSMNFIETCGVELDPVLKAVDLFTSHECLLLEFESAMTAKRNNDKYYNLGAHFVWIGDRTRQLDHAHVEYCRGIANPIGIKVGPTSKPDELVDLIKTLWGENPENDPGKIVLITRFGAENVEKMLPPLLKAVQNANLPPIVWTCDPMHGNTTSTQNGTKTRSFDAILKEAEMCIKVHMEHNSFLGGLHFELTGDHVTECTGGPQNLSEKELEISYQTRCDPRLNYSQSIEMAFRVTHLIKKQADSTTPTNKNNNNKRQRT